RAPHAPGPLRARSERTPGEVRRRQVALAERYGRLACRIPAANVRPVLRVYRIPFSTNVERVSLALAPKGLEAEWEDVDAADRSQVERVSGQPLVPVLVHVRLVIADST